MCGCTIRVRWKTSGVSSTKWNAWGIPSLFVALICPQRWDVRSVGLFHLTWIVQPQIYNLNSRHFVYRTSRTTYVCTLNLSTLLVEYIISSVRINRMTTRCRCKFRICTTANDLTLYSFSLLYIFVTWGWTTVTEKCRQPNKTDTKTIVFWSNYLLLIKLKILCSCLRNINVLSWYFQMLKNRHILLWNSIFQRK